MLCFVSCNIPQILQILRTKSSKDINPLSCKIAVLGNVFSILASCTSVTIPYGFLASNVTFTIVSIVNLYLCLKYR